MLVSQSRGIKNTIIVLILFYFSIFVFTICVFSKFITLSFLPLYLPKFCLQSGLASRQFVQRCFQLFGGRKFGESGLLDVPGCRLE